jgi:hypothetical protein
MQELRHINKKHIYIYIYYISSQPDTTNMKNILELRLEVHCICWHTFVTSLQHEILWQHVSFSRACFKLHNSRVCFKLHFCSCPINIFYHGISLYTFHVVHKHWHRKAWEPLNRPATWGHSRIKNFHRLPEIAGKQTHALNTVDNKTHSTDKINVLPCSIYSIPNIN